MQLLCYNISMKILSPAGNAESLRAAINNGADEVYLGVNDFNARNNVDGFTLNSLKEAVNYARIFGVKVLLAINILFSDDELQSAVDTVVDAYNLGVDAFIVQDLGLIKIISENYPQIEIHASTQMGIHNLEGAKYLNKYDIKRIVLARETPLSEVKRIKDNSAFELEYFVQGALCVSFSGNCYLSSYLFNASGNRGRCKQLCRLPYTLTKDGKKIKSGYLLSAKDFNMTGKLSDLKKAGVDVLKIEGRARRPFYVATATREYFNALYGKKADQDNLKLAFNRTYTEGYFNGNGNIISELQNHIGIEIGKVEKFTKGKNFNQIIFTSNRVLSPKSVFKFIGGGKENTLSAFDLKELGNGRYLTTTTQTVAVGDLVHLIVDAKLEETVLSAVKKRQIEIELTFKENARAIADAFIDGKKISVVGEAMESAQKQPLTEQEIVQNFNKNEYFAPKIRLKVLEKVFMPKQKLNAFRRQVYAAVVDALTKINRDKIEKVKLQKLGGVKRFENFEYVFNLEQKFTTKNVVYSPEIYDKVDIEKFKKICEKQGKTAYLDLPNFATEKDILLLKDIVESTGISVVANNYYALDFNAKTVVGAGLNVYNTHSAAALNLPVITAECDLSNRIDFPYMTLRHCPIKNHLRKGCENCAYSDGYEYRTESGKVMKLKRKKLTSCTFYLID